ncbi:MAG: dephospho-CoA kinase [Clostridiaceae bacterium]|nr:dephospho-CoA kinase [Clostridiaceae bacterium]
MKVIGITGGIGSGKSTAARILKEYGAKVIFADEVAKSITEPNMPAYKRIIEHFGGDILDLQGRIDRRKLGDIVFNDEKELLYLNEITHGIVAEEIGKTLEEYRKAGFELVVVEAIVPIEHGFLDLVDTVWVVVASEDIRIKRIMRRNRFSYDEAIQRIRTQMSEDKYKSIANKIIYNNGTVEDLKTKIRGLLLHEQICPS